ncbi:MAG: tetratricopeptide repeat protein [Gemmataceae bacterium]
MATTAPQSILARAHFDRAIDLLKRQDFQAAVTVLDQALQLQPDSSRGHLLRGRALNRLKRYDEAESNLDAAIRLAPDDHAGYTERGTVHVARQEHRKAFHDFDAAIQRGAKRSANYFQRGGAWFNLGEWKQAAADFSAAIAQDRWPRAFYFRGLCQRQLNDPKGALADFSTALELEPTFADAYRERAGLLAVLGQYEPALADATHWIQFSPDCADAYSLRGEIYARLRAVASAVSDYREALRLAPDDVKVINRLAWVLAAAGPDELRNGREALELATRANGATCGKDPLILDTLAAARAECGDMAGALEAINQALIYAPSHIQAELNAHRERLSRGERIRDQV